MSTAARDIAFQVPVENAIAFELARRFGGMVEPNGKGADAAKDFTIYRKLMIEVKCDYRSKETRNAYLEVRNCYRNKPSGLTATKADRWAFYTPGDAVFYTFNPRVMLKWLEQDSGLQPLTKCGDNNSDGYLVPLKTLSSLPFVKTHQLML